MESTPEWVIGKETRGGERGTKMRGRGSVGRCLACKNRAQYGSQMEKQGQVMCQEEGGES